jgi:hypothetical protein
MVVAILPIVGTALLAIAMLAASDARRTTAAAQGAQARQLLLAGGEAVVERSGGWKERPVAESFALALPAALAEGTAEVQVVIAVTGTDAIATIDATYAGRAARQTITLARSGDRWRIIDASLDGTQQ